MMTTAPRRCLDCGRPLSASADPRRRFCGPACVSRAYRKRVRMIERYDRRRHIIRSFAQLTYFEKAGIVSGALAIPGIQCPVCGKVVWQGVRRRANAVYCGNACRQEAYRLRRHDGQP